MGQRHQIYVIARVRRADETTGHRRCIAAYHHQWCYGRTALNCLSRFVRLASQPDNALMIRRDIASVQGKWGHVATGGVREDYVPCPFVAYLVQLAWNVNFDDVPVYVAGTTFSNAILDARMQTSEGDNNDGITIVDITDPAHPSYCFNAIGGPPLSAEDYVRQYYPKTVDLATIGDEQLHDDEGSREETATERLVMQSISALEGVSVMSVDLLVEAWPQEYSRARKAMIKSGSHVPHTISDESLPRTPDTSVMASPVQPVVQSLTDISLRQAVLHAISEGDTQPVQDLLSMPGQSKVILETLCDLSPLPQAGVKLLELVIGREQPADALDLSGIELSPSAILAYVKVASSTLVKLDLTGNIHISIHDIATILSAAPNMRQLIMFDCPLISDEDIYEFLVSSPESAYTLEIIGHNAFFRRARDARPSCPYVPAFTCIVGSMYGTPLVASLPYFTPNRLLRSIYTLLKPVADASAASAALQALGDDGAKHPTLAALSFGSHNLFSSTAVLHAALTTWYENAVSVTDAIRATEGQEPDPCGLRAGTQRIVLIPQTSTSWDGWLLLMEPVTFGMGCRFAIARKRRDAPSTGSGQDAALALEIFSLGEFVKALQDEGRPAPPAEDVAALADVIETAFPSEGRESGFDPEGAVKFLKQVSMRSRMFGSF